MFLRASPSLARSRYALLEARNCATII